MIKLAIAIPTVGGLRGELAKNLAQKIGGDPWIVEGRDGLWQNARRTWQRLANEECTHCMLIQDDVDPVPNFLKHARRAIRRKPKDILNFFCHREGDLKQAAKQGAQWLEYRTTCWGQCVVMPRPIAQTFLDWAKNTKDEWVMDDSRVAFFAASNELNIYNTVPSLMQHRGELQSTWIDRDGRNLQSPMVGPWLPGDHVFVPPDQLPREKFVELKSRWLRS